MTSTTFRIHWLAITAGLVATGSADAQANATPPPATSMELAPPEVQIFHDVDKDADGTVSLSEANKAATRYFKTVDVDHDGTLDKKEARSIRSADFQKADVNHDGTLDKKEFLALVKARFTEADTDRDGTVSMREGETSKGRDLLSLLH